MRKPLVEGCDLTVPENAFGMAPFGIASVIEPVSHSTYLDRAAIPDDCAGG